MLLVDFQYVRQWNFLIAIPIIFHFFPMIFFLNRISRFSFLLIASFIIEMALNHV